NEGERAQRAVAARARVLLQEVNDVLTHSDCCIHGWSDTLGSPEDVLTFSPAVHPLLIALFLLSLRFLHWGGRLLRAGGQDDAAARFRADHRCCGVARQQLLR